MAKTFNFLIFFLTISLFTGIHAKQELQNISQPIAHPKLFVFGDSYGDTGNFRINRTTISWNEPYGMTYPGRPSGRFSNGRILTDYVAEHFGIISPTPFEARYSVNKSELQHGMNFAYGGTGVFDTLVDQPRMTVQIDNLQRQLDQNVYTKQDLDSSIALISLAGSDYSTFILSNDHINDAISLRNQTRSIIRQLSINLKRLQAMGIKKISITSIEPMGCLPNSATFSSYQNCTEDFNTVALYHNQMLWNEVQKLNNTTQDSFILLLDLYGAFMSGLKKDGNLLGNSEMKTLLQPCCVGINETYFCGSVDKNGKKKYSVCKNPEESFFWDDVHPSQNGWKIVYDALRPSLDRL
ncbi:hypothetical protein Patl1_05909 [Pistacia atlantica]|uniref:Uncharacterized protein n=1 Tax=Pistacia atlantica TaxID=434234 RepID=A0ACC1BWZ0_9ROSI|nr:hypothetical protein Patl1_05909 [Pistacia atlantica]